MTTATAIDFYEVLGVPETASQDDIRKAYLALARKYHPDKTGGDKAAEEKLKKINEAYDTLKNPGKRQAYDEARRNPFGSGGGFEASGGDGFGFDVRFEDIFSDLFGGGAARQGQTAPRAGADLEVELTVSLEDVLDGTKKTIRVPQEAACDSCHGSGAAPGTKPETCSHCGGSGRDSQQNGAFFVSRTCPHCHGTGQHIAKPCSACRGVGAVRKNATLTVNIPAGVSSGTRLCLRGQGNAAPGGGPAGNLYVRVTVQDHPLFRRSGRDVVVEVPVRLTDAALGANIEVPTLRGSASLRIPEGTQNGATLRMRGLGLPSPKGHASGDQLVRVLVEVPAKLNAKQRRLLEEFQELDQEQTYPSVASFISRLRKKASEWVGAALVLALLSLAFMAL